MFTFYGFQEVNTVTMTDKKERARIGNILLIEWLGDFGHETKTCVTKSAFNHARFSVNFQST